MGSMSRASGKSSDGINAGWQHDGQVGRPERRSRSGCLPLITLRVSQRATLLFLKLSDRPQRLCAGDL